MRRRWEEFHVCSLNNSVFFGDSYVRITREFMFTPTSVPAFFVRVSTDPPGVSAERLRTLSVYRQMPELLGCTG